MKHCTDYFTLSLCWLVSFLVLLCINFLLLQQTEQRTHLYLSACQIFNGSCNMIGSWHDTVICLNTVALWHSRSVEGTESCTVLFLGIWSALGTSDSNSRHTAPPINVFDIWSSASQGLNAVDQVAVGTYTSGQRKRRRPKKTLTRIVPRKLLSFAQSAKYCHYAYAVHCVLKSDP